MIKNLISALGMALTSVASVPPLLALAPSMGRSILPRSGAPSGARRAQRLAAKARHIARNKRAHRGKRHD